MTDAKNSDPDTASIISQAVSAARSGNLKGACDVADRGLRAGGDVAALNALLGVLHCRSGDLERGIGHLRVASERQPQDLTIVTNLASALIEHGAYREAMAIATRERAKADRTLRLARFRGFAAQSAGDYAEAVAAYQHVVDHAPSDWEAWHNLGSARAAADDHNGSVAALRRAVELNPDVIAVRLNFAMALERVGAIVEAEQHLRDMAEEFPEDARPLFELHVLLKAQGREEDALEAIEAASERDPRNIELLLALASQRLLLEHTEDAVAAYRQVLEREPGNPLANLKLAVAFDLTNRTDALDQLVDEAARRGVGADVLNFMRALGHRRAKRFAEGLDALKQVPDGFENTRRLHLLGELLEGMGNFDEAFDAFSRMNAKSRNAMPRAGERAAAYRDAMRTRQEMATPEWADAWREQLQTDARPSPVFLVGFPRSGTTLLDTMLMGHPAIEVLEEEPTLNNAAKLLPGMAGLPAAAGLQLKSARDAYFETAAARTPLAPGTLLVDKHPLSMNALPVIHRLFPDARIILALRHPCDVVLSCFATNFRLNDATSNFVRLDTAAELYDLSFSYFERVRKLFALPVHRLFYENLVKDRESELRSLLDFLSLDWNDEVLDHQATARARSRIKTASYAQVAEPVYTRAAGRWENYRKHLDPVLPILEPWIRKFGYAP